ncbi:hypothetical protein GCM10025865_05260 [Paraoerskovia sediminicola]|uniref:L,D-TPase catalytic domain-containing protein n=1 Tax=Paraoerskovia sediminicola TaxID=1138587 RepID=A0ABN6X8U0_9CELL|nr:peptidoglycan-binding protein [Paraoerskovia sediminicola]BDZ41227.1 hypothetical protein GCM10025865_05260 [Paraoerskovia sediminicola]
MHLTSSRRRRLRLATVGGLGALVLGGCSLLPGATPGPAADGAGAATAEPVARTTTPPTVDTPSPAPRPSTTPSATPSASTVPTDEPTPDPTSTATPSATPTAEPQEKAEPEPEPTTKAEPVPTEEPDDGVLRRGDSGPDVKAAQQRLVDLGYWGTGVDGAFGSGTTQAVWAFQKAAGLSRDGVVGPRTLAALEKGVRPKARTSSGHVIEVDLARQIVLLVDDGKVTRIMNASSGSGTPYVADNGRTYSARTHPGSFAVGRQVNAMYESGLGLGDMYRPKFFDRGIAIHGSPSIPPYPASHGCVRVANSAINYIWDTWGAPPGTKVVVY